MGVHERRAYEERNPDIAVEVSISGRERKDRRGFSDRKKPALGRTVLFSLLLRSVFLSVTFNCDTTLPLICWLCFYPSCITCPPLTFFYRSLPRMPRNRHPSLIPSPIFFFKQSYPPGIVDFTYIMVTHNGTSATPLNPLPVSLRHRTPRFATVPTQTSWPSFSTNGSYRPP